MTFSCSLTALCALLSIFSAYRLYSSASFCTIRIYYSTCMLTISTSSRRTSHFFNLMISCVISDTICSSFLIYIFCEISFSLAVLSSFSSYSNFWERVGSSRESPDLWEGRATSEKSNFSKTSLFLVVTDWRIIMDWLLLFIAGGMLNSTWGLSSLSEIFPSS